MTGRRNENEIGIFYLSSIDRQEVKIDSRISSLFWRYGRLIDRVYSREIAGLKPDVGRRMYIAIFG